MTSNKNSEEAFHELAVFLFEEYKRRKQAEVMENESSIDNLCLSAITT